MYNIPFRQKSNLISIFSLPSSLTNTNILKQKCMRLDWVLQLDVKVRMLDNVDGP